MKIFSAEQMRRWDAFTIQHEPISSIELMERAAGKCMDWIIKKGFANASYTILCGKGNNGGDGLAIARLLTQQSKKVSVFILESDKPGSQDFETNLQRSQSLEIDIHFLKSLNDLPFIDNGTIIIDAVYGTGLNQPLTSFSKDVVDYINRSEATIISIDLPSGLFADQSSLGQTSIHATYTLTFQTYKLGLLLAENADSIGEVHVLNIGLSEEYHFKEASVFQMIDEGFIKNLIQPRNPFSHKGSFGHALLIGGSFGKMGAIVLSASACARAGCGLVTTYIPLCGYAVMQTSLPEAMTIVDENEKYISDISIDPAPYNSIGIGPGMNVNEKTIQAFSRMLKLFHKPIVIDADALNILANQPELFSHIFETSILTPHPKELERLFGKTNNEKQRIELTIEKAKELQLVIVLKGHHTLVAFPDGTALFNSTGNAGMAKGGSGDVLTGIITSFLAQGYTPEAAAILGVYIHGLAGDLAMVEQTQYSLLASDIIKHLSNAFERITS